MKFMVIVKASEESEAGVMPSPEVFTAMEHDQRRAGQGGVLLAGEGLHPSSKGVRIRFSGDKRTVIDGPFTETKVRIAGFWLSTSATREEAIESVKCCGRLPTRPPSASTSSASLSATSRATAGWGSARPSPTRRSSSVPGRTSPPPPAARTSRWCSAPNASPTAVFMASVLVINRDGTVAGFQDKMQVDPAEDGIYTPGEGRRVFEAGPLTFGIAICHEGWRYPETVRWAARRGAHLVFHPHYYPADANSFCPSTFADPANTFHEKAALCRAAENTIFFATVNYASDGSPTTSAVVRPDGTLQAFQPYGQEGVLVADIDLAAATGLLASRLREPAPR